MPSKLSLAERAVEARKVLGSIPSVGTLARCPRKSVPCFCSSPSSGTGGDFIPLAQWQRHKVQNLASVGSTPTGDTPGIAATLDSSLGRDDRAKP